MTIAVFTSFGVLGVSMHIRRWRQSRPYPQFVSQRQLDDNGPDSPFVSQTPTEINLTT